MKDEAVVLKWIGDQGRPVTPAEVEKGTGVKGSSVRAYIAKFAETGDVSKVARGLYQIGDKAGKVAEAEISAMLAQAQKNDAAGANAG